MLVLVTSQELPETPQWPYAIMVEPNIPSVSIKVRDNASDIQVCGFSM